VDSISLCDILVGDEDRGNIYFLRSGSPLLAYNVTRVEYEQFLLLICCGPSLVLF